MAFAEIGTRISGRFASGSRGKATGWDVQPSVLRFPPLTGGATLATIGKLSEAVADSTGAPLPTVMQQARELRNAHVIVSTVKGFGAAQMSPLDAARLLIAVMGSDTVRNSAETVLAFAKLKLARMPKPAWATQDFVSQLEQRSIGSIDSLLANIIQLDSIRELFPPWSLPEQFAGTGAAIERRPTILIEFFAPALSAAVRISANKFFEGYLFGDLAELPLRPMDDISEMYQMLVLPRRFPLGGMKRSTSIGLGTIRHIGKVIGQHDAPTS